MFAYFLAAGTLFWFVIQSFQAADNLGVEKQTKGLEMDARVRNKQPRMGSELSLQH